MKTKNLLEQGRSLASFEQKDGNVLPTEPGKAIEQIAGAFEAFRKSHDEQIAELKKGVSDPVLTERLARSRSRSTMLRGEAEDRAAIAAERKEREELELRLQRLGVKGDGDGAKAELERKEFNILLAGQAAEQKTAAVELDDKGYDEYKAAFDRFMRKNDVC
jgi:hypothetical protein